MEDIGEVALYLLAWMDYPSVDQEAYELVDGFTREACPHPADQLIAPWPEIGRLIRLCAICGADVP